MWDSEQKRNCTRSLTCKSHSVYLKRKVINRTGPFDELLAQHKAEKEATTVRSSSAASTGSEALVEARSGLVAEPTSILERRLKLSSGGGVVVKAEGRGGSTIQVLQPQVKVGGVKEVYCDDSLHYTTGELWVQYLLRLNIFFKINFVSLSVIPVLPRFYF